MLLFYIKYIVTSDNEAIAKLGIIGAGTTITMCASPLIALVSSYMILDYLYDFGSQ